jgi:DNA (cytosine-5)-methyltransferase 1
MIQLQIIFKGLRMSFKIFSTFTGAGGLDIGFHGDFNFLDTYYPKLNFTTTKALEINQQACDTVENNNKYFANTDVINADITKVNPTDFTNKKYDVLLGGFPCVTFSVVGKQMGLKDDINGKLYESFVGFVEALQPKVFLAENVKGILSANKGEAIQIITKRFENTGYKLKVQLVNFADYGVPQLRQRVLFIGIRKDINEEFNIPKPIYKNNHINVEKAFQKIDKKCVNNNLMKQLPSTTAKLKAIPEGGNFRDLPPHLAIKGLMSNIYRRLDRKKPAYTVLASGGGGTWTYHYEEPRALTNRERARLQTFPDDLIFKGSNTEVRRQIGNAVPAVGVYPFAKEIERILKSSN